MITVDTSAGSVPVSISRTLTGSIPRFDARDRDFVAQRMIEHSLPHLRNDSQATAAFARQLEYRFKEVYKIEFPALRASDFIPLNTEVPEGALTFTYRMWNKVGQARVITGFANDLPNADVDAEEWQSPVITLGASYLWTILEMQRSAMADVPLEALKAEAARFAIEYLEEQIAAAGYANAGVPGLTNAPGIAATTQVSTGGTWLAQIAAVGAATASAPAAAVAAVQGIAADCNAMVAKIYNTTIGIYVPNTALLPTSLYIALKQLPRSPAFSDDTALDYLEKMTGLEFDHWPQLNTLGNTNLGRVMVYDKDPAVLRLIKAQPFTQLPPQPKGLAWEVPCMSQIGGVNVLRPGALTYMDGLAG